MRKSASVLIARLMVAAMLLSWLPRSVRAAGTIAFEKVTEETALVSGQYVLLGADGYAPGCLQDGWLVPMIPGFSGSQLTGAVGAVWTLDVSEAGVLLTDPAGIPVGPGDSDETGLTANPYHWQVCRENGLFSFHGTAGETPVTLCWGGDQGFRAYDDRLVGLVFDGSFTLYRMTEQPEEPSQPTEPSEEPTDPTKPSGEPTDSTEPSEEPSEPEEMPEIPAGPGLFFGQLHSHTADSDGMGTPAEAYAYAKEVAGLDFLAITDHSNSFDGADQGVLSQDGSLVSETWQLGREAAEEASSGSFLALYGFEMTWQNGLGHISTFFTPGFQSRTQEAYANSPTALDAYYQALATVPGSVSQFNHPGSFYGEFGNFAHHSDAADRAMALLEVVCEGVADYDSYTRALDLGWHVAPTNNQNNHNCRWGDADSGRTVVYAEALTEEAFSQALANRRVYATEDADLEILYRLDGHLLGSRLTGRDVGETVTLTVSISDPTDGAAGTVEVIVDGGTVAASQPAAEELQFTLPSSRSYYYLRITQPDGDVAVTAPVWIRQHKAVEIPALYTDTLLAVQNQPVTLQLEVANRDSAPLTVAQILFTIDGQIVGSVPNPDPIPGNSTAHYTARITAAATGAATIRAVITGTQEGEETTAAGELTLTFLTEDLVTTIVADDSHAKLPSLSKLEAIAAKHRMQLVQTEELTAGILSDCDILLIPAPVREYNKDYVNLLRDYLRSGRTLILCGQGDATAPDCAARLNGLLEALRLSARFRDDLAFDPVNNGGRVDEIYTTIYNEDISFSAPFCQKGGCTLLPGSGTRLVTCMATTFSVDGDDDGETLSGEIYIDTVDGFDVIRHLVGTAGEAVLLAREETAFGGDVILSGGMFLGDEVLDPGGANPWDTPNGNALLLETLLAIPGTQPVEVLPLSGARNAALGETIRVRGYVTAGTAVECNRFENLIYLQDDTGGLMVLDFTAHGVSVGTPLELYLLRQTDGFHLLHWEELDKAAYQILPAAPGFADAAVYEIHAHQLVQAQGKVISRTRTEDGRGISRLTLEDPDGNRITAVIEPRIASASTGENTLAEFVKEGNWVSVVGIVASMDGQNVLRVRNCDEVVLIRETGKLYRVVSGQYTVWTSGKDRNVAIEVECPGEEFLGIEVDGVQIPRSCYRTRQEGNLHFTLLRSYLKTLTPGLHNIVFTFRDGTASAELLVWVPGDNPPTGDQIFLPLGMMRLCGGLLRCIRRKKT